MEDKQARIDRLEAELKAAKEQPEQKPAEQPRKQLPEGTYAVGQKTNVIGLRDKLVGVLNNEGKPVTLIASGSAIKQAVDTEQAVLNFTLNRRPLSSVVTTGTDTLPDRREGKKERRVSTIMIKITPA